MPPASISKHFKTKRMGPGQASLCAACRWGGPRSAEKAWVGAGGCGAAARPRRGQGRWVKGGQVSGRRWGGAEGRSLTPGGGRKV